MGKIFLYVVLASLFGCGQLAETELSLRSVRGTRYECLREMHVSGIKRQLPSSSYDYITLFPEPGIAGPEVVDLGIIPAGTVLEIDGLLQQGPAALSRVSYRVKIVGPAAARFAKEDVRLTNWKKIFVGRDEAGQPILSPDYFRRLETKKTEPMAPL